MADDEASLRKEVLNVAEAEVETKVQPHGVRDDLGREAVASIGRTVSGLGGGHQTKLIADPDQVDNSLPGALTPNDRLLVEVETRTIDACTRSGWHGRRRRTAL